MLDQHHKLDDTALVNRAMERLQGTEKEVFSTAYRAWFSAPLEEHILVHYLDLYRQLGIAPNWVRYFAYMLEESARPPSPRRRRSTTPERSTLETRVRVGLQLWYELYGDLAGRDRRSPG